MGLHHPQQQNKTAHADGGLRSKTAPSKGGCWWGHLTKPNLVLQPCTKEKQAPRPWFLEQNRPSTADQD